MNANSPDPTPDAGNPPGTEVRAMRVLLFGYPPTPARAVVIQRKTRSRVLRAGVSAGTTFLLTPLAAILPPHAPWALGVLLIGGVLTWRGWTTREVVSSFHALCPRCGEALDLSPGTRLRAGLAVPCPGCGMSPLLHPEGESGKSPGDDQG